MTFRNRVGRATITQSMFGMSMPSVEIAEPFEDIMFAAEMGGKDYEPQFTRTGYLPVVKPSIIDFRSAVSLGMHRGKEYGDRMVQRQVLLHLQ